MERGIQHRTLQRCPRGHEFFWSPGLGRCPYCELSPQERTIRPPSEAVPCPPDCCPQEASGVGVTSH
jgi:hypothetical protein